MDAMLFQERRQPQFDPVEFQSIYYGPPEFISELKKVFSIVASNPSLAKTPALFSMTRPQQLELELKKLRTLMEVFNDTLLEGEALAIEGAETFGMPGPHGVHFWLFVVAIKNLADKEQREEWMDLIGGE